MTKNEIRSRIKTRLDEDGVFRPDAQIDVYIEETAKLLCVLAAPFRVNGALSIFSGYPTYQFPNDFFLPIRLSISGTRVLPCTPHLLSELSADWVDTSGTPKYYFMVSGLGETKSSPNGSIGDNQFWLYPRPSADDILNIDYAYFPPPMANDSLSPELPEVYHHLYEDYGVYMGLMAEPSAATFPVAMSVWEKFLTDAAELGKQMANQYRLADFSFIPWDWKREAVLANNSL